MSLEGETSKFEHDVQGGVYGKRVFVYGWDGTNLVPIKVTADADGQLKIAASALPLPSNASQETGGNLASILGQLNITLSALRDAIRGASTKDFTTLDTLLQTALPRTLSGLGIVANLNLGGSVNVKDSAGVDISTDTDDNDIAGSSIVLKVICLNYVWSTGAGKWIREVVA